METKFAELIWDNEPISSGELVKLCERELAWKNRRLIRCCAVSVTAAYFKTGQYGFFTDDKEEFAASRAKSLLRRHSTVAPRFLAALRYGRNCPKEIDELKRLIDKKR